MNSAPLVSDCGKPQTASPYWTVQRSSETKINSHAYFLLPERKAMFCKNIYSFSYSYYSSCITFMFNGWLTQTSRMFEGRRKAERRGIAFVPYFVPYIFEKQTLRKYKKKHFKFTSPLNFFCLHLCFLLYLTSFSVGCFFIFCTPF